MKSIFPITVLLSLTLITACGGSGSSSSGSKPAAVSYAQKNSSVCITDQKKINAIVDPIYKKDVIISDGCLKKGSVDGDFKFLTDVNLSMRVDFDDSQFQKDFNRRLHEEYIKDSFGLTLDELKKGFSVKIIYKDTTGALSVVQPNESANRDFELKKPVTEGLYDKVAILKHEKHGHKGTVIYEVELLFGELIIEVKK